MKNRRLEERRKKISKDIDIFVKRSFDIVDRIYEILEKQGKEQKDLAFALGKKESEISKWMTGTHNFTIKTISKIESVLGESILNVSNHKKAGQSTVIYIRERGITFESEPDSAWVHPRTNMKYVSHSLTQGKILN
ncbi:multiprotein-bridging factor 1 family protein [Saccharicrinis sp. FJH2]|uniref:helix-turn-helix domain-containing protein n=1 Tax=Saccharicrinis sp. FJH65 TaxID=3344659 RepID=UPI0035F4CA21